MAPPRSYRVVLDVSGQELPKRHDGNFEVEQDPTFMGHVLLAVNGKTEYECRLTDATKGELEQTLDELAAATDRLGLAFDEQRGEPDGA